MTFLSSKKLFDILDELQYYKNGEKKLEFYIQQRLDKSNKSYYQELLAEMNSLLSYDEKTISKAIMRGTK